MAGDVTFGVRLSGDSRGATQALTLTRAELDRLGREMTQTQRRTRDLDAGFRDWAGSMIDVKGALAGLAGAFAAEAIVGFVRDTISSTAEMGRLADAIGVSSEKLQVLTLDFQKFLPDAGISDVADALSSLSDIATDAAAGGSDAAESFALIGITVDQLRGKRPAELFRLVAQGIAQTDDPTKKLTAAVRLLGDELGVKLLPLLAQGGDGLDEFSRHVHEAGLVMTNELVTAAEKTDAAFNKLITTWGTKFKSATLSVNARVQEMAGEWQDLINMMDYAFDRWSGGHPQLPPVTVTASKNAPMTSGGDVTRAQEAKPADVHRFTPMEDTLDKIRQAHQDQWLGATDSADKLNEKLKGGHRHHQPAPRRGHAGGHRIR